MDAPTYFPATVYVAPERLPSKLSAYYTPISMVQANPAAWKIATRVIPLAAMIVNADSMRPHLGNFSFQSLIDFGVATPESVKRLETEFRAYGETK